MLTSNKQAPGLQALAESVRNVALGLCDPEALTSLTIAQYDNTVQSNSQHQHQRPKGRCLLPQVALHN
jgi:hypothetical protein